MARDDIIPSLDSLRRRSQIALYALESASQSEKWSIKYRPTSLAEMALSEPIRRWAETLLKGSRLDGDLILWGPSATGKTTLAYLLARHFFPAADASNVWIISAKATGGVDAIRDQLINQILTTTTLIERAAKREGKPWWNLVIISEADGMSDAAQGALNDAMETHKPDWVFLFTTNKLDKILPAIRSRCSSNVKEMGPPPVEERARVLTSVLVKENVQITGGTVERIVPGTRFATSVRDLPLAPEVTDAVVSSFASQFEDMRQLLDEAKDSIAGHGTLRIPAATAAASGWGDWPDPVDGAQLLDKIAAEFRQYISLPEGGAETLAMWIVFSWAHEAFTHSPILALASPTMGAGKSTLFDIMEELTRRPKHDSGLTAAVLFRLGGMIEENPEEDFEPRTTQVSVPTLPRLTLFADEVDAWAKLHPEVRAVLDSGHSLGGSFSRVVRGVPRSFSTWFPKGLGFIESYVFQLEPTVRGRSIIIPMRTADAEEEERLKRFRKGRPQPELTDLKRQAARWVFEHFLELRDLEPLMPKPLRGRREDSWRPLFAIASLAGGHWPQTVETTCLTLTGLVHETEERIVRLINDIREIFESDPDKANWLPTEFLLDSLRAIEGSPWKRMNLEANILADMLGIPGIDIHSKQKSIPRPGKSATSIRGYVLADFDDAFKRYPRKGSR